jgi:hypothetical protein
LRKNQDIEKTRGFMKINSLKLVAALVLLFVSGLAKAQTSQPDPNFHLYLLIGQSNMSGRGALDAQSKETNSRVLMLTKDLQWRPATDPLHFDKRFAAVGPGLAFGKAMAQAHPGVRIGLIPCAVGGTSIHVWVPGAKDKATKTHPYDDMLKRVLVAQQSGVLKGILWHQGEADRASANYTNALVELIARLRHDLNAPDVPFVAGELGTFNPKNRAVTEQFNARLDSLQGKENNYACVSSRGLKDRGDRLHFNTASARILGKRYAQAMLNLQREMKPANRL